MSIMPRLTTDTILIPSSLSLAGVSRDPLQAFTTVSSQPRQYSYGLSIPTTPTLIRSKHDSDYTYLDSNTQSSSSDACAAMTADFFYNSASWTQDPFNDAEPSNLSSWSSSPQFIDAVQHNSDHILRHEEQYEAASIDDGVVTQSGALCRVHTAEHSSYDNTKEPNISSANVMAPFAMRIVPSSHQSISSVQPSTNQIHHLLTAWEDYPLMLQSAEPSEPSEDRQQTLSEPHIEMLPKASPYSPISAASLPSPLAQFNLLNQREDLGAHLASMHDPSSPSGSSSKFKVESTLPTPIYAGLSSPALSESETTSSGCHSTRRSSTAPGSFDELTEISFEDADMYTVLSYWNFASSQPYASKGTQSDIRAPTKKRRASGDVKSSRRKKTKSSRPTLSHFRQNGTQDASSGSKDVIKSSAGKRRSSTTSSSISNKISLRVQSTSDKREEDQEIGYPKDEDLLQRCLLAQAPKASSKGEPAVETNVNVMERSQAGELDLYTPRWSRGNHREREGWCHLCEQGGWYSMKRSQYLYHLQYDHGVSSQTKEVFDPPKAMRVWDDSVQTTEGKCATCNCWIPICFGPVRKRNFKIYFKHIHTCQRAHSI